MAYINKARIIVAEKYEIKAVKSVKIKSSWRETKETCNIEVPDLERFLGKNIKEGDPIKVELSMSINPRDDKFQEEFTGYIANIKYATPFTLECENETYVWQRKKAVSKHYGFITLKTLLKELFGEAVVFSDSLLDLNLQKYTIKRKTPYQVLLKLKQAYAFTAYFKGKKLYVGTEYAMKENPTTRGYALDGSQGNIVKDSLIYKTKESVKVRAKVISVMPDGKKIEVTEGDETGTEYVMHYRGISDENHLKQLAKVRLDKLKKDMVEGSVDTFGLPFARHSDHAKLQSAKYPKKNGVFFIDSVDTTFGTAGFRRKLKLGKKMS
ncbi:hypothetical protein [uncultured Microscilla sp.]|uniref:hypothetical protein n=1 Tax=uncultured Microscilla sp. TaxID=432653 RepID=UPI0026290C45|nr:hypothetical protein [uncultured Microscilla sp.]